jgi:hypothetical protein
MSSKFGDVITIFVCAIEPTTGCQVAPPLSTNQCHLSTIDWSSFLPHVCPVSKPAQSPPATCFLTYLLVPHHLPHQLYDCTTCTVSLPCGLYGLYSHPFFFTCLVFLSECDIFRIQSPFDEVNIWSESRERDRRNGIDFV